MKAAPFEYLRAQSLDEVCEALAAPDGEAMVIAGGQTLVPLMAMRLARPALLIDINEIASLAGIDDAAEAIVIRAGTRQSAALASPVVRDRLPLLAKALPFVGHLQTRNRGTVGGSVALGDPSAEIPLVAVALGAEIRLARTGGTRSVAARDFFTGAMETARASDECVTVIAVPVWNGGQRVGTGFQEVAERAGDFAIVAAAAQLAFDADGVCRRACVAVGGASPAPVRAAAAEEALIGRRIDEAAAREAALLVGDIIDPQSDSHAPAAYRRRVAPVLAARAILEAAA